MAESGYVIKPEAFAFRVLIRERLSRAGLRVTSYTTAKLTREDVRGLYPAARPDVLAALEVAMCRGDVEVGLLDADDVTARLLLVAGAELAPGKCNPETIRRDFGQPTPEIILGKEVFLNAFHRPVSQEEIATVRELFSRMVNRC